MSIEEIKRVIATGHLISLTCKGEPKGKYDEKDPSAFKNRGGFVGVVKDDSFEFQDITNPGGYFSNYADPPELKSYTIKFADVETVGRM
jgi:hypothetical protein